MFTDRIHDQLHDLAGRTEDSNRTAAARLLEAKAAVEAAAPADLAGVLTELDAAMVNAIRATGGDAPNRCE